MSLTRLIPGTEPAAHCYCGHQFGYFSGQLGDGATMYLGEVINSDGERWEMQFKGIISLPISSDYQSPNPGAGKTPYSRTADGRKVLRSSLREFLCSEVITSSPLTLPPASDIVSLSRCISWESQQLALLLL